MKPASCSLALVALASVCVLAALVDSTLADTWDPTLCTYSINGKVLFDVSSLRNPAATYKVVDALGGSYFYYYNFCPSLNQTVGSCSGSDVICQMSFDGVYSYSLGTTVDSNGVTRDLNGNYQTVYRGSSGSGFPPRCTTVTFICNANITNEPFMAGAEVSPSSGCLASYNLRVAHACCCPGTCVRSFARKDESDD